MEEADLKIRIIEAALDEFNEKGIKFTMDQIAKRLGISKKTIYTVFADKETMLSEGVEHGFGMIKCSETNVLNNKSLDIAEKIRRVLIVLPERFRNIDFRKIYEVKDIYPKVYQQIRDNINSGWEPTLQLMEQGMREQKIKPVNLTVFKVMVEASIEDFISSKELIQSNIGYEQALEDMITILMKGIEA